MHVRYLKKSVQFVCVLLSAFTMNIITNAGVCWAEMGFYTLPDFLNKAAIEASKKIPYRVGAETIAYKITADNKSIIYDFQIEKNSLDYRSTDLAGVAEKMKSLIASKLCKEKLFITIFTHDGTVKYRYVDIAKKPFTEFLLTRKDCNL